MMSTQEQTVKKLQDQKSEIKEILEKLRQKDSEFFMLVVDAIHNRDYHASRVLANEIAEIRKAIVIIENASENILAYQKFPDLLLCPRCCSPEISISQGNTFSRCYCLDCDKIWIAGMDYAQSKGIEKVWSLA